jgi:putative ABC transport system substrate-binding protein
MKRRDFIRIAAGSAAVWPLAAHAQRADRVPTIGILAGVSPEDPQGKAIVDALSRGLQEFGWIDGKSAKMHYRGSSDPEQLGKYATELTTLAPDIMVATGGTSVGPLLRATKTIPIVFANVPDPVGSGFIESLSRPGGNATGFVQFEYNLSGKWLDLLKQIAPEARNVAVLWDPTIIAGVGQLAVIQSVAPALGLDVRTINVRDDAEIERADLIVALAARHKLPTIYFQRTFVAAGGLVSYGPDFLDQYRRAAGYVDRILKGERPAELPVQAPTRYELVVNLRTAKALGLAVSPALLARTDEAIE